ncbi:unnamed protein product [Symbiodinium sp. CCMP2592]|nr:unnamed protein product [Symbiodinium sp. CCMP2592]
MENWQGLPMVLERGESPGWNADLCRMANELVSAHLECLGAPAELLEAWRLFAEERANSQDVHEGTEVPVSELMNTLMMLRSLGGSNEVRPLRDRIPPSPKSSESKERWQQMCEKAKQMVTRDHQEPVMAASSSDLYDTPIARATDSAETGRRFRSLRWWVRDPPQAAAAPPLPEEVPREYQTLDQVLDEARISRYGQLEAVTDREITSCWKAAFRMVLDLVKVFRATPDEADVHGEEQVASSGSPSTVFSTTQYVRGVTDPLPTPHKARSEPSLPPRSHSQED